MKIFLYSAVLILMLCGRVLATGAFLPGGTPLIYAEQSDTLDGLLRRMDQYYGATMPRTIIIAVKIRAGVSGTIVGTSTYLQFLSGSIDCENIPAVVTIRGGFDAPARQIFENCPAGSISFAGNSQVDRVRPEWWGAIADDSTDTTLPMQAALTAACGRTLHLSAGTYQVNTSTQPTNGVVYVLLVDCDNTAIEGEGTESILKTTLALSSSNMILIHGAAKVAGVSTYPDNRAFQATQYTLSTAAKWALSLTVATPADAGNFAAGDDIFIRTGQVLSAQAFPDQPDSEINQVVSVDAGTGVITLRKPLVKTYLQEKFFQAVDCTAAGIPGGCCTGAGTGCTNSPSTHATLATGADSPFAVAKVTDRTIHNFTIRNLKMKSGTVGNSNALFIAQVAGLYIHDLVVEVSGVFVASSQITDAIVTNNTYRQMGGSAEGRYCFAPSTGSTDIIFAHNLCSADTRETYFELHEGIGRCSILDNMLSSKIGSRNLVSIRARAYDIYIKGNLFVIPSENSAQAAIFVDPYSGGGDMGGEISENTIWGNFTTAIHVQAPGWIVRNNTTNKKIIVRGGESTGPMERFSVWAAKGTTLYGVEGQNPLLGTVPQEAVITGVKIYSQTAWNSDGTDLLSIGTDADNNLLAGATDIATTGWKTPAAGTVTFPYYVTADQVLEAYYVNGGSEPTTGRALVVVEYYRTNATAN